MPEDRAELVQSHRRFSQEMRSAVRGTPAGSRYTRLNLSADEDLLAVELERIAALFAKKSG